MTISTVDKSGETIKCPRCGGIMGISESLDGQYWICGCGEVVHVVTDEGDNGYDRRKI